jgi:hypothetical protein
MLCGKKSLIEAKIDQFPFSEQAREMLNRQCSIENSDQALLDTGVCSECLALPVAERNQLAKSAIKREQHDDLRDLIRRAFLNSDN